MASERATASRSNAREISINLANGVTGYIDTKKPAINNRAAAKENSLTGGVLMDFESYKLRHYRAMRDVTIRQFRDNIVRAKRELEWAKVDRKHGYRVDYLEAIKNAAHYREEALWWYARYKKKCEQIAELES